MPDDSKEVVDIAKILLKFSKSYLMELLATFAKTDLDTVKRTFSTRDKSSVARALSTTYNGVATSFISYLKELKTCSLNSLKEVLVEEGVSILSVEGIQNKNGWLLFVYKNSLQDKIKSFFVRSKIAPTSLSKEYLIVGKLRKIDAGSLQKSILQGIEKFNKNSLRQFYWRHPSTFAQIGSTYVFNISIFVEGKEQRIGVFRFRQEEDVPADKRFEVTTLRINRVGKKEVSLIMKDAKYLLNTNIDLARDKDILDVVLKPLFLDAYSIEPVKYAGAENLVRASVKTSDLKDSVKRIIESFNALKEKKIKEIQLSKEIPVEKKKVLAEVIENITFGGVGAGDTPEYSVETFSYMFKNVESAMRLPGSKEMIGALLSVSKSYVLKFNYKSTRIILENGEPKPSRKLDPSESDALKILFGGG